MRPIIVVLAIAAALLVQAPADAAPPARGEDPAYSASATAVALPPVTVSVYVAPHIPQEIVERLLAEASDLWRPVGVTFAWVRGPEEIAPYGRTGDAARYRPSTLRVGSRIGSHRVCRTLVKFSAFTKARMGPNRCSAKNPMLT